MSDNAIKKNDGNVTAFPVKTIYQAKNADSFLKMFRDFSDAHLGPEWLKERRYSALTTLEEYGLPTSKLERWKYTDLPGSIRKMALSFGKGAITVDGDDDGLAYTVYDLLKDDSKDLSGGLIDLLCAEPAGSTPYGDMMLWEMNNAFLQEGVVVDVPAGKIVDKAVEIHVKASDGLFFSPRFILRLAAGADLTIIEYHDGQGAYWNNQLTQIEVGPNARLRHYRIQEDSHEAVYTQTSHVKVARDGVYESFTYTAGAAMSRNQIHTDLEEENSSCVLAGVNLLAGRQHGDSTILVEHHAPHGRSDQFYRTVLDEQARGVFQGKVHVHREGQHTDGYQLSNTLLLSEGAEMDTKPELEIYADDVKCSHGATTGQIDEGPLFYLRSRGLDEETARALLVEAFIGEAVDKIGDESVRDVIQQRVQAWLAK